MRISPAGRMSLLCALILMGAASTIAAEPNFAKEDVFVRGANGYHTFRIPGLAATPKGTLLLFCDGRVNNAGDLGKIDLVFRRSLDGGRTWEKPKALATDPGPRTKIGNVATVMDRGGAVHAIYCRDLTQAFCLSTTDEGATFEAPVDITPTFKQFPLQWKYFATGHAHGIQLETGRLLVPVFLSGVPRSGPGSEKPDFRVGTIHSDDHARTWKAGGLIPDDNRINESTIYPCADGSLAMNSRSTARVRMTARSTDAGLSWAKPAADKNLSGAVCQGSALVAKTAEGKRVLLFSQPTHAGRKSLTIRLSYDDGKTWPVARVIAAGPSAYGDLAVGPDGTIYFAYENGEKDPYDRITVARFNVEWLMQSPAP